MNIIGEGAGKQGSWMYGGKHVSTKPRYVIGIHTYVLCWICLLFSRRKSDLLFLLLLWPVGGNDFQCKRRGPLFFLLAPRVGFFVFFSGFTPQFGGGGVIFLLLLLFRHCINFVVHRNGSMHVSWGDLRPLTCWLGRKETGWLNLLVEGFAL